MGELHSLCLADRPVLVGLLICHDRQHGVHEAVELRRDVDAPEVLCAVGNERGHSHPETTVFKTVDLSQNQLQWNLSLNRTP